MIRLFKSDETNFEHNKWVLSECTSAKVTENIIGLFYLDLEYPLLDTKNISQYLVKGNIIKCPISTTDTRGEQLFVIRTRTPNTNSRRITIYAECIARYDLGERNFVLGIEIPAGKTRKEATQLLLKGCVEQKGETVGALDTNTSTSINLGLDETTGNVIDYLDIAYVKPLAGLIGDTQSIQKAYGGEIIYNNKEINFVDSRGSDHSFEIRSGKNLQELSQEISDMDSDSFATALIMCSSDGIYLPNNEIIISANASSLGKYYKVVNCSNISAVDNSTEALDIVYAQLREEAQKLFDGGLDKLPCNNTINFIQLSNSEEYKDYAVLEKCEIGNNVTVKYSKANISAEGRVTEIKFNPLWNSGKGKIEEVTIGDRKTSIVDTITATSITVADTVVTLGKTKAELKNQGNKITAVVQSSDGGMSWELNEHAFIICCTNSSDSNVAIDGTGLTVNNGKIVVKNSSGKTVFKVNTDGQCNAVGGFVVEDSDSTCKIDSTGITMTNEAGYTSSISVSSPDSPTTNNTTLVADDDFQVNKILRAKGTFRAYEYAQFYKNVDIDGTLSVGTKTLEDIIDARIKAAK